MRKLAFSIGAVAIAVTLAFAWSHTLLTPSQAGVPTSINPTDIMAIHNVSLPIEQWDAI